MSTQINASVHLTSCSTYDESILKELIRDAFSSLGISGDEIRGKRVAIKPNLVMAASPDKAATTHPAFVRAAADVLNEFGAASITLAESPGGPWNAASMGLVYRACKMTEAVSDHLSLNSDYSWQSIHTDGKIMKNFHCITAIAEADVVVDLCKLKSHSLTGYSGAVKNLFGIIPGVEKFEMHSTFPDIKDFSEMLVDLCSWVTENKTFIAVCDAISAMEGNGPTHGTPTPLNLVLISRSPYALDCIGAHLIRRDGEIAHLNAAASRGLMPAGWQDIPVLGLTDIPTFEFRRPDSDAGSLLKNLSGFMGGRLAKFFEVRPKINRKRCAGCGKCVANCPRQAMGLAGKAGKKHATINPKLCIRCYCCQELCPLGAVDVKQNPLIRLVH